MIEISFDRDRIDRDIVFGWLRGSYWSPGLRREVFERAIENSLTVSAFLGGQQVGYARLVTDYATFAWLCDVYVHPDHRGLGIAQAMITALQEREELATLRRWVLATADAHKLYEKFGYEPVPAERWMHRVMPKSAWTELD